MKLKILLNKSPQDLRILDNYGFSISNGLNGIITSSLLLELLPEFSRSLSRNSAIIMKHRIIVIARTQARTQKRSLYDDKLTISSILNVEVPMTFYSYTIMAPITLC